MKKKKRNREGKKEETREEICSFEEVIFIISFTHIYVKAHAWLEN
jgi:hypothetical protein